eukprot:9830243-Alexandrium_andersonii.AAC.1
MRTDTATQRPRDTETQRHGDADVQRRRGAETQRHRDTCMHARKHARATNELLCAGYKQWPSNKSG